METNKAEWVIKEFCQNTTSSVPLDDVSVKAATAELVTKVSSFPRLNKRYVDPPITGQTFGLITFIPAKGTVANEKGFYGYVKIRGTYDNLDDCSNRIDYIIRNVDSANHIHVCKVGAPVPLVTEGYAEKVDEIDIKKEVEKDISANVRAKELKDKAEMKEIEERADALKKDVDEPDPEDAYIAKRLKLATLRWAIKRDTAKLAETKALRDKCVKELKVETEANPEWEKRYLQKYLDARKKANIPDDQNLSEFMGFFQSPIVDETENVDLTG